MKSKPYTTPVWWLGIVLIGMLTLGGIYLNNFWQTLQKPLGEDFKQFIQAQLQRELLYLTIFTILLLAEGWGYWRLRYLSYNKWLAISHLVGWILAILVIPLLYAFLLYWLSNRYSGEYVSRFVVRFSTIEKLAIWASLIIGHGCFALLLVDVYKMKKAAARKATSRSTDSADGDWMEELHDLID